MKWHNINEVEPLPGHLCIIKGAFSLVFHPPHDTEYWYTSDSNLWYPTYKYRHWIYYDEFIEMMEEE